MNTPANVRPDAFKGTAATYLRRRPPYPKTLLQRSGEVQRHAPPSAGEVQQDAPGWRGGVREKVLVRTLRPGPAS